MNAHTRGPWIQDHFQYAGEHQRDIYAELEDGSRVQVAAVAEMLGIRPHWEPEANARLIAAAPELLEALEALAKACNDNHDGHDDSICRVHVEVVIAERAIAKARGEAVPS